MWRTIAQKFDISSFIHSRDVVGGTKNLNRSRDHNHAPYGGDFLARDVIYRPYILRLCYDVSVRLSVRLSVTEVHLCIIANLGFKFRSKFTTHCGRGACGQEGRDHRREKWRDHLVLC